MKRVVIIGTLLLTMTGCSWREPVVSEEAVQPTPTVEYIMVVEEVEEVEVIEEPVEIIEPYVPDEKEVELIAKTLWGECRGVKSEMERAAVAWCILNRVESESFPNTIEGVVTAPHQFSGYFKSNPVTDELYNLAVDVMTRWHEEQETGTCEGRVLPKEFLFFTGDGYRNHFKKSFMGKEKWDWSLENPYES